MNKLEEQHLRLDCLKLAATRPRKAPIQQAGLQQYPSLALAVAVAVEPNTEQVLAEAKAFAEFVIGPTTVAKPKRAPAKKKARRR